ncbi:hypothetical protein PILCRDRAFT_15961 [Piloderma croceum F 1598]|uniref:DUF659 domain-containing protein n=1 Tax=Piloderma croceum (strain F 1598) TaxID=765440 RepID=A0A0C3AFS4_PILCF|nr:hypothetical protein PILCRDRAFT_15961 [Piloderma croceum F 1598]
MDHAYRGVDMPFSSSEIAAVQAQALQAAISANLLFRVYEDPEIIKLFWMMQAAAPNILPSAKAVGRRLLNDAAEIVELKMDKLLHGKSVGLVADGWKSLTKSAMNGVYVNVDYKSYTLELVKVTSDNKDGPVMADQFESIIDHIETKYNYIIIYFMTDSDGGSKKGCQLLEKQRPWLLAPSCWAHQGTTNGTSNVPTTVNKTVVSMAHVFHEFVPGAPFHPPISYPTAILPTDSVIPLRTNSLLKHNEHQLPLKSPDTWGSLALHHIRCTRQQNHPFCKSIYTIPARRSTFTPIANAFLGDEGVAMWVEGTCGRGSAGFEVGVATDHHPSLHALLQDSVSSARSNGKVRKMFDASQAWISLNRTGQSVVLAYLTTNLTRWTTHCVAFIRLFRVQDALKLEVMQHRSGLIKAQDAEMHCDLIADYNFWEGLEHVVGDIEPICYRTNINQKDSTRADQVLLTLAGIYTHFSDHPIPEVADGMTKWLEKCWKDCDQPLFLLALILNPFKGLSSFGENAGMNHFKCNNLLIAMYQRLQARPCNQSVLDEQLAKERAVSTVFMQYLTSSGVFAGFREEQAEWEILMKKI